MTRDDEEIKKYFKEVGPIGGPAPLIQVCKKCQSKSIWYQGRADKPWKCWRCHKDLDSQGWQ